MLKKLIILILVPFLLCSCSQNNSEEITFSSWGSITETTILQKIISDFEQENPNIHVRFIHIPQNYFQKLHLLFASNQAPDVIFINNLYLPLYAEHLTEVTCDKQKFYLQSCDALSYKGKNYAIPRDISNLVLYYNKELVSIPQHWDFQAFVQTLNQAEGKYKISFEQDIYWAQPYILTLGEKAGVEFYKNLEGKYAPTPAQIGSSTLGQMFLDGDMAFYLSGRWMYPKIKEKADFSWDIVKFPGITPADASGWAISKTTKHAEAAKKFVNYLASPKCLDYFAQTGLIIPAETNVADKIENGNVFLEAITTSKPNITDKNYKKNSDRMNKELFN